MSKRILFLCTGNSCRSQMAQGWAKHLHGARFEFASAGLVAHGLNPLAVRAMADVGVDISSHQSQTLDDVGLDFDVVITVCGHADESCPVFTAATKKIHIGFDDPPKLAQDAKNDDEAMPHYARVRDEIGAVIAKLDDYL